ncbi:hypothetical protein VitviT2T_018126 [Vitis vinifera]|uniref:Leucine-rich repeat-containing N-terminal plant-type domain-containing protein n=1 Tax=Vitis vinifera TaxID=29760 RepID=A0ABY9CWZ8_VITVI|nr:hypothetical protein VitviT2T_018126 [Vitis vinifera]
MFLKLKKLTGLSDKNLDCMKVAVDVNKLTYKQASTDLSIQQFRLSDNYTYSMTMTKAWRGCSIRSLQPLCHDSESSALLQFKQSFLTDEHASYDPSAYSKVSMWKSHGEGSNCCSWDGLSVTGRLVMLSAFSLPVVISMVPSTPAAASSVLFIFKGLTSLTIISITLRSHVELVSFRG